MAALQSPWQLQIIGPSAVGKMTVGRELAGLTGATLLHNHMLIDLLTELFPFDSDPFRRLHREFRHRIAEEAAVARRDLIMTGAWPFDDPEVLILVERWMAAVTALGASVGFVELRAPLEVRLARNQTEPRRVEKKLDWATNDVLIEQSRTHRYASDGDFPFPGLHLVIDSTEVSPAEAAGRIVSHFGLVPSEHVEAAT